MMRHTAYIFRGEAITRIESGGWETEGCFNILKTVHDAKEQINKHLDGTNKSEPRIIGTIEYNHEEERFEFRYFNR